MATVTLGRRLGTAALTQPLNPRSAGGFLTP